MLEYYRFKEINDLFLQGRKEEAQHLLSQMQARYIAICDENLLLKKQVEEMEDTLFLSRNLIFDGSCYWLMTGSIRQGPFCPECYNREGALIRLEMHDGEWQCPVDGAHEGPARATPTTRRAPRPVKVIPFTASKSLFT